ncbi:hypothetical protein C5167_008393 [Papaver somniferum]|uniref:Uncharacterized protein n=1 Tax=Papaver somniferum TaxID=3469 RepID=A0A4Y7JVH0_PAPSO|nr:hypothetical protein C5167_008393 [Papaver somniferum]
MPAVTAAYMEVLSKLKIATLIKRKPLRPRTRFQKVTQHVLEAPEQHKAGDLLPRLNLSSIPYTQ